MEKACCVVEMPKRCADCKFRCSIKFDNLFCYMTMNDISSEEYYEIKPSWCPLKPMPEKETICGKYDSEYYANGGKMPSWKMGWNACIDAICGKD